MNGKKAKAIRKMLKSEGVQVREATYGNVQGTLRERVVKDAMGSIIARFHTVTRGLTFGCGRDVYKKAKIMAQRGELTV